MLNGSVSIWSKVHRVDFGLWGGGWRGFKFDFYAPLLGKMEVVVQFFTRSIAFFSSPHLIVIVSAIISCT